MKRKFIFITGGVISALGKGITTASLGALLEGMGLKVNLQKLDPYINIDAGTMNPIQHGEVYVTDDGAETDLDLGYYERFTNVTIKKINNVTTGKIYKSVIEKERKGIYLGETVQVIPHITDEIIHNLYQAHKGFDVLLAEIGGTVGDIESLPFLDAIRQISLDKNNKTIYIHMGLVPFVKSAGEYKTKPIQHSTRILREIGILPDILISRSEQKLDDNLKKKIALFCSVGQENVINIPDVDNIYKIPVLLHKEGIDKLVCKNFNIKTKILNIKKWKQLTNKVFKKEINIAIVGKYSTLVDAYKSLVAAIDHAAWKSNIKANIDVLDSDSVLKNKNILKKYKGIIVAGGFGKRGVEGKIKAIEYARVNNVPFLGICLGLQLSIIEYCRNVLGIKDTTSSEFSKKGTFVIDLIRNQKNISKIGGTMRLGAFECKILKNSKTFKIYKTSTISERHRHRFEVNNKFKDLIESKNLKISGINPQLNLVEIIELNNHPWYLAVQFHPEFKSKPFKPHPLFISFVKAINKQPN